MTKPSESLQFALRFATQGPDGAFEGASFLRALVDELDSATLNDGRRILDRSDMKMWLMQIADASREEKR
jgi:hypothetical protein